MQNRGLDTEIAEQRFVHVGGFAETFRHITKTRFRRMILKVVRVDYKFRGLDLILPNGKEEYGNRSWLGGSVV